MKKFILRFMIVISCLTTPGFALNNTTFTTPVVNKKVSNQVLTYEELRAIFLLNNTKWKNNQKIVLVVMSPENPVQKRFLWEYLGMTSAGYQELINAKISIKGVSKPLIVDSDYEMLYTIGTTPGSIGFVGGDIYGLRVKRIKII